ncbi:glycosyltransferase family protein [Nocardioides bigeumensis]|uniref:Spore protein YkvP/CgeB glycosyl transferase-like domain-containing protein n=1 Tax=Nocardioides bigeumensis TaxID=433657 RepID=A0ABN2YYP8_9ACTN
MGAAEVAASVLFDDEWYAAQVGVDFGTRADAAAHYVAHARELDVSPHPLFEPAWLYPAGRWRESADDPLSHYLGRRDRASLSTHPLLPDDAEEVVAALGPDALLPRTTGPRLRWAQVRAAAFAALTDLPPSAGAPRTSVVVSLEGGVRSATRWLRRLYRAHVRDGDSIELVVRPAPGAERRTMALVALSLPGTRLTGADERVRGEVTVRVDDTSLEPPEWAWLQHLVDRLDDPAVGQVGPLLVEPDQTVVAAAALPEPFLRGETPADVARMAHLPVPELWPGVVAFRTSEGPRAPAYVVPDARVVSTAQHVVVDPPDPGSNLHLAAGFEGPGRPLRIVEGRPALRWAIDIAAPLAPRGRRWGDDPFARSLAAALERLDQRVTVDHPETRNRASRDHDDVVLVVRGLEPVAPTTADAGVPARMLWVISHPAEVTAEEVAPYDVVLAASARWAAGRSAAWGREVRPLLQCTDTTRFHPGLAEPDSGPEVLFVGNSRGTDRPVVSGALAVGLPLTVYGDGWDDVPETVLKGRHVPNEELGALYASAGVVLADHWTDMRAEGFVANRTFDVLASAGRLLSDEVPGLADLLAELGTHAPTWSTPADLAALARPGWRDRWPSYDERVVAAERVVARHGFDARARSLLELALSTIGQGVRGDT